MSAPPAVEALYTEAYPNQMADTKLRMLSGVLPVTQLPEEMLERMGGDASQETLVIEDYEGRRHAYPPDNATDAI